MDSNNSIKKDEILNAKADKMIALINAIGESCVMDAYMADYVEQHEGTDDFEQANRLATKMRGCLFDLMNMYHECWELDTKASPIMAIGAIIASKSKNVLDQHDMLKDRFNAFLKRRNINQDMVRSALASGDGIITVSQVVTYGAYAVKELHENRQAALLFAQHVPSNSAKEINDMCQHTDTMRDDLFEKLASLFKQLMKTEQDDSDENVNDLRKITETILQSANIACTKAKNIVSKTEEIAKKLDSL